MRSLRSTVASLCVLAGTLAAHADTVDTYKLHGTLDSGSFAGTIVIDVGPYITNITAVDIVANGTTFDASLANASNHNSQTGHPIFQYGDGNGDPYSQVEINGTWYSLYLKIAPDGNGYRVCTLNDPCHDGDYTKMTDSNNYGNRFTAADISVVTPEPSSLLLLSTAVGLAATARRKLFPR